MTACPPITAVSLVYRWAGRLAGLLRVVSGACIAVMASVTMAEIILRYFFSVPLPWANELARTLFIWSVMLGIAVVTWLKAHIAVRLLEEMGLSRLKCALRAIALICLLLLALILTVEGASFASINLTNVTPALQISLAIATAGVAAGGFFTVAFGLLVLLEGLFPVFREAGAVARRAAPEREPSAAARSGASGG